MQKLLLFVASLITLSTTIVVMRLPEEVLLILGAMVALGILSLGGYLVMLAHIFYRSKKIDIDHKELQASIVQSDGAAWIRERIILPDGSVSIEFAKLGGPRLRVNSHDHLPTQAEILYAHTLMKAGQSKLVADGKAGVDMPQPVDLLPMLDKAERVLVQGASDAGKSTLLYHIAQRSKGVLVIDPHFAPGEWPVPDNQIIGKARDFNQVDKTLNRLMAELDRRYERRARGDNDFEPITIIIDEFMTVRDECKQAGKILATLIRESRKVNFRLFIGSHSKLVKALGLDGVGDVRAGLVMVQLDIDQITKERTCTINGERAYFPPFGSIAPDLVLTDEEAKIMAAYSPDKSLRQVSQEVWGPGKIGTYYNDRIKATIEGV